ncbi:sensor histidine kinase [Actinomadura rugatobispora]|uniref:histidine kinase n=1 Tax=Actinomadura rugatobispora TaxID=1994 RepID=A0ABW0ZN50_9ACTN|nr:hypothetical protein GCM10010200_035030 [Actinomadura rugatobispora]
MAQLRSAFAEVEDCKRLELRRGDPARLKGGTTAEISHLLAELIENALAFSPPGSPVEVWTRMDPSGHHIAVVDRGIGMAPAAMACVDTRAGRTPVRSRHEPGPPRGGTTRRPTGVKVRLQESPLNGITAPGTPPTQRDIWTPTPLKDMSRWGHSGARPRD